MEKDVVFKMHFVTKELMEVFTEDSDNDTTFYGFSEEEQGDNKSQSEDEDHGPSTAPAQPFRLRVALRSRSKDPGPSQTSDEDPGPSQTSDEDIGPSKTTQVQDTGPSKTRQVRQKRFNFAEVSKPVAQKEEEEDEEESFLAKREQNIKANKAMLAQLMADLHKIPGGAGFLKRAEKTEKRKSSHPPRSGGDLRKNPERASRRRTRSMGGVEGTKEEPEEELELSLEEELLQVKRAPRRRAAPRPSQTTPHVIRSVDDITAEELEQVADGMTEKVYNKVTGSTCHQCRQKTIDTKTCCRSEGCRGIQGQFCGPCLKNRYGEDVKSALLDPLWQCPPCRRICNCSFCRQREGRCPTGILLPLAQYHGFSDVHSYLTSLRNKFKDEES